MEDWSLKRLAASWMSVTSVSHCLSLRLLDDLYGTVVTLSESTFISPLVEEFSGSISVGLLSLDLSKPCLELCDLLQLLVLALLTKALLFSGFVDLGLGSSALGSELKHVMGLALGDYREKQVRPL